VLLAKKVDALYVAGLKKIYTNMDEFRNIIGIFVKNGKLYFDPCSEGAYLCKAGEYLRGTHKSSTASIMYVPVSFVNFLQANIPGLKIKKQETLMNIDSEKWY